MLTRNLRVEFQKDEGISSPWPEIFSRSIIVLHSHSSFLLLVSYQNIHASTFIRFISRVFESTRFRKSRFYFRDTSTVESRTARIFAKHIRKILFVTTEACGLENEFFRGNFLLHTRTDAPNIPQCVATIIHSGGRETRTCL